MEESNTLSLEDKLNEIERILVGTIHKKVTDGIDLSAGELNLLQRWLKAKDGSKASKLPQEPLVTKGQPLPFLTTKLPFEEQIRAYEEDM